MKPIPEWLDAVPLGAQAQPVDEALPPVRRLLHAVLVVAGWLLFAWGWVRVTAGPTETVALRTLMLWALLVVPVLTLAWVAHNVGIHRRKGPRRSVPAARARHEIDFNGRRLDADWAALAGARRIDIVLDGETKRFAEVTLPEVLPLLERAVLTGSRP